MDGIHDLGGRQGFGRVNWEDDEGDEPFHEGWEARLWSMATQLFAQWRGKPEIWTLDWFRHVRERIDPVDYLTRPYFDQWAQCLFAILIDNGTVTLQEVIGVPGVIRGKFSVRKIATTSPSVTRHDRTRKNNMLCCM